MTRATHLPADRRWRPVLLSEVLLCAALLSAPLAGAAERGASMSPQGWLERMNRAFLVENYDGVFTFLRGAHMSSLRVLHAVIDGVQHERLIHLDGSAREIIRIGGVLTCVLLPGDELAGLADNVPAGPLAGTFTRDFSAASPLYRLRLGGASRIAGRNARQLTIQPVDRDRYGYELWLDEATGLLLKSELHGAGRVPLEVFQFGQLRVGASLQARDFVAPGHARQIVISEPAAAPRAVDPRSRATAPRGAWSVGWLPAGFAMAASDVRRAAHRADALSTMMYGDGVAAFSVFIEPVQPSASKAAIRPAEARVMHEGATVAMTLDVNDDAGKPFLVTVVGEVPDATAAKVLRSVRYLP